MRLHLIACAVFQRELMQAAAASPHQVEVGFLPKSLHDRGGAAMAAVIQERIDAVADDCDAVLLGYALCNNGLLGLRARAVPLVAYRAHDCIACLLGSQPHYQEEFRAEPGTYWLSAGWIERPTADGPAAALDHGPPRPDDPRWLALVAKYGEDNAAFLWEEQAKQTSHYQRLAYIDTGVGPQAEFRSQAERVAAARGWRFQAFSGERTWIDGLVAGAWDEARFIVVPPGGRIAARHDGTIAAAEVG